MLKIIYRIFLYLFFSSLLYVVILKFVDPPITATQITNAFGLGLHRDYIDWREMSDNIKLAALASEDQSFTDHSGFDWDAIEKSLRPKKKKKKSKIPLGGGASTITQQTAKNVFLWQGGRWDRYLRKIPEFYFTFLIELVWGKQRILEVYLNVIEMGPGIYGAEAASQHYYQKTCRKINKSQAAAIASVFPLPLKWSPLSPTPRLLKKRAWIKRQIDGIVISE